MIPARDRHSVAPDARVQVRFDPGSRVALECARRFSPRVPVAAYSDRLEHALRFAAEAHQGQVRKKTTIPYITHPFHVALILERHGFDEDTLVTALLHDVVEDS